MNMILSIKLAYLPTTYKFNLKLGSAFLILNKENNVGILDLQ